MSLEFPENMNEVQQSLAVGRLNNPQLTEDEVIINSINDHFQSYLDEAEEGHYDTGKLVNNEIVVVSVFGREVERLKPLSQSFIADFKEQTDNLLTYLEEQSYKIARK